MNTYVLFLNCSDHIYSLIIMFIYSISSSVMLFSYHFYNLRDNNLNILSTKNITIINSTHNKEDFQYDHHIKIDVGEERNLFFTK